ncbi:hypothetical protein sch_25930 [Serratia plymuthica]|nr:hypothetical protein sch_25930 [Serratia plymuthica]
MHKKRPLMRPLFQLKKLISAAHSTAATAACGVWLAEEPSSAPWEINTMNESNILSLQSVRPDHTATMQAVKPEIAVFLCA